MTTILPSVRNRDKQGAGYYGARRGSRTHVGVDFVYAPGDTIHPFVRGVVTKLGYAYGDDLSFRYIEIKDARGYFCRYFYVEPTVDVGDQVDLSVVIGTSQRLGKRYAGITEHVHFEVFRLVDGKKQYFNPFQYLAGDI